MSKPVNLEYEPEGYLFEIEPDFKTIKKYLFSEMSAAEYKKMVKAYKQFSVFPMEDFTKQEGEKFLNDISNLFAKYPFIKADRINLMFILMFSYKSCLNMALNIRIPNSKTKRPEDFVNLINFLLANNGKNFEITFKEILNQEIVSQNWEQKRQDKKIEKSKSHKGKPIVKPISYNCNNSYINNWITGLITDMAKNNSYPLSMGLHLFGSEIKTNPVTNQYKMYLHEHSLFETDDEKSIWVDAMVDMCIPIINYLNIEQTFLQHNPNMKKSKAKYWSPEQLEFTHNNLYIFLTNTEAQLDYQVHPFQSKMMSSLC